MPGRQDNDHKLIKLAQQGDQHAFGDLYQAHAPAVFRYLFAHLDNAMDAEDLTGEVFLKAWQALPKYIERGVPFLAYLFRIAHNALVDHYRTNNRFEHKTPETMEIYRVSNEPEPVEELANQLEHQKILKVLSRLKTDYQSVLTLRFIGELSPQETAQVMRRSVGAVRVLQHRALAALRTEIDKLD